MAVSLCMKRMAKERLKLEQPNDDYFVYFDNDDNLLEFHAYVIGPTDTLYDNKFVKLKFNIPDRYPLVPPTCKFIQYSGDRIHPNLYVEGKVCLSILGTWAGEPWALAMTIETVLITIRSLLDNEPYKHEPHQSNHPEFNKFVQYGTWTWLLTDYLKRETNEAALSFLRRHVAENGDRIVHDLKTQHATNGNVHRLTSPYNVGRATTVTNYSKLIKEVTQMVSECRKMNLLEQGPECQMKSQDQQEEDEVMAEACTIGIADSTTVDHGGKHTAETSQPFSNPTPPNENAGDATTTAWNPATQGPKKKSTGKISKGKAKTKTKGKQNNSKNKSIVTASEVVDLT